MDSHVKGYYSSSSDDSSLKGHFYKVISLHETPGISWDEIHAQAPQLCRGWFELSHLNHSDRIEFCRDFWLAKLPYHPNLSTFVTHFFSSLDTIGIYLVQQKFDDPFEPHLIYSLKDDQGFFRGLSPATEKEIEQLKLDFPDFIFPEDYLAFLSIHNGLCKTTDCTGIIPSTKMKSTYQEFQAMLSRRDPVTTSEGSVVDPKRVIPFYVSFGMPFFQCFWAEWFPENEMGNVYYSGIANTITDIHHAPSDNMAFSSFSEWFMFYLEKIE